MTDYSFRNNRLTIRISKHSLSFSVIDKDSESGLRYEPYTMKSGISIAANLRDAFRNNELLKIPFNKVLVMLDTPVLFVPVEEYHNEKAEVLYNHAYANHQNDIILKSVLPDLNVVSVFSVNKDLNVVIEDHFSDINYSPISQPIWNYMHQRSYTGNFQKVYGYFHDKKLDIFCFDKNRFRFSNTFETTHFRDAAYFLLYVWNQLSLDARKDEMHLAGQIPDKEELVAGLKKYLMKVYVINPSAEFNRAPITQIKNIPFDLLTRYTTK